MLIGAENYYGFETLKYTSMTRLTLIMHHSPYSSNEHRSNIVFSNKGHKWRLFISQTKRRFNCQTRISSEEVMIFSPVRTVAKRKLRQLSCVRSREVWLTEPAITFAAVTAAVTKPKAGLCRIVWGKVPCKWIVEMVYNRVREDYMLARRRGCEGECELRLLTSSKLACDENGGWQGCMVATSEIP